MKPNDFTIRTATENDAERLLDIYAPYVTDTAITFEYDVPSVEDFRQRIRKTLTRYPYLVAERDGQLLGYAYASAFKERRAYDHCVETSIYVDQNAHGQGLGRALYDALESKLKELGVINICACIAWIEQPNQHLTHQSVLFHDRMGFNRVAHFHRCGYKFDEWYDMVWMEKLLDTKYFRP